MSLNEMQKGFINGTLVTEDGKHYGWIRQKQSARIEERAARIEDLITIGDVKTKSGATVKFGSTNPSPVGMSQNAWKSDNPAWQEALDVYIMRRCNPFITLYQKCKTDEYTLLADTIIDASLGDIDYWINRNLEGTLVSNGILEGTITWVLDSIETIDHGNGISTVTATFKQYGIWTPVEIFRYTA